MKILLDHCVDHRLANSLTNHEVKTAHEMGWEQLKNGELLASAAVEFDVVLTVDRNLQHQQNLSKLPVAVIVLIGKTSRLTDLIGLIPQLEKTLQALQPGTLMEITA